MAKFDEHFAARDMAIGEVRNVTGTWAAIGASKHLEITRTGRAYVFDLCDAANKDLHKRRNDIEWVVGPRDSLYLRDCEGWTDHHTRESKRLDERDRAEWMDRHHHPERYV